LHGHRHGARVETHNVDIAFFQGGQLLIGRAIVNILDCASGLFRKLRKQLFPRLFRHAFHFAGDEREHEDLGRDALFGGVRRIGYQILIRVWVRHRCARHRRVRT
jgi:hypothetical protein